MYCKSDLTQPGERRYLYDGSLAGFYCCVYASVYGKEIPYDILPEEAAEPSLFEDVFIATDPVRAKRVRASVAEKVSPRAQELLENVFCSCLAEKERKMLLFLLRAYREGGAILRALGRADVAELLRAEGHLLNERHLLLGFVRFSDYDGVLGATITPKNFILPYIAGHFVTRYRNEDFIIVDKTHRAALFYLNGERRIARVEEAVFPEASETEERYRALWKKFYRTIAIKERENPRCRMTHMPKRYWENMTEMREYL